MPCPWCAPRPMAGVHGCGRRASSESGVRVVGGSGDGCGGFVVWRLGPLECNLPNLVSIVNELSQLGVEFDSLAKFERNLIHERAVDGVTRDDTVRVAA